MTKLVISGARLHPTTAHTLEGHTDRILTLKFFQPIAPVDKTDRDLQIITGGCRGNLRCWNAVTGALLAELEPHESIVSRIKLVDPVLHEYCSMLAAGANGAIKAWKFDGTWVMAFPKHTNSPSHVSTSMENWRLALALLRQSDCGM